MSGMRGGIILEVNLYHDRKSNTTTTLLNHIFLYMSIQYILGSANGSKVVLLDDMVDIQTMIIHCKYIDIFLILKSKGYIAELNQRFINSNKFDKIYRNYNPK